MVRGLFYSVKIGGHRAHAFPANFRVRSLANNPCTLIGCFRSEFDAESDRRILIENAGKSDFYHESPIKLLYRHGKCGDVVGRMTKLS